MPMKGNEKFEKKKLIRAWEDEWILGAALHIQDQEGQISPNSGNGPQILRKSFSLYIL